MMGDIELEFESVIQKLTKPLNHQYPRPWVTDISDPLSANVFIVGRNQAKGYPENKLTHRRHIDALFNRNGENCRDLYDEMTGNKSSPTRKNIDRLRMLLLAEGVSDILETNVICYSTPMSPDLGQRIHRGGKKRGTEIFGILLEYIKPKFLIAHGSGAIDDLSKILRTKLPPPPKRTKRANKPQH